MEVRVKTLYRTMKFALSERATVPHLRELLAQFNPGYRSFALVYDQKPLDDTFQLSSIAAGTPLLLLEEYQSVPTVAVSVSYWQRDCSLVVPACMSVAQVKESLSLRSGLYPEQMIVTRGSDSLSDSLLIGDLAPTSGVIAIAVRSIDHVEVVPNSYKVYAKTLTGFTLTLDVNETMSISVLKKVISERVCVFWDKMNLIYAGVVLNDGNVLRDYSIYANCTIFVVFRLNYG